MIAVGSMESGTLESHRSPESLWIMAPGLDTLASASADSEPVPAGGDSAEKRSRKRNAAYDDIFVSVSPRKYHEMDKTVLLADVLAAVLSPPSVKSEIFASSSVGAANGRKQASSTNGTAKATSKTTSKAKANNRGANKAQHTTKPKTPSTASSSSYTLKNHSKTDTDSSDCDDTSRTTLSSGPACSLMVVDRDDDDKMQAAVVLPARALTVRERHR